MGLGLRGPHVDMIGWVNRLDSFNICFEKKKDYPDDTRGHSDGTRIHSDDTRGHPGDTISHPDDR